eukprot:scaffold25077_cov48-Cyclotella_meneghiniana.AAC.4
MRIRTQQYTVNLIAAATLLQLSSVQLQSADAFSAAAPSQTAAASTTTAIPPAEIRLNVPEKARTVCSVCTSGTLCTSSHTSGIEGAPFGSFVDYVLDDNGNPVLLMNEMSMHTLNIQQCPDGLVTLFAQLGGAGNSASTSSDASKSSFGQDVSRCSITGSISKIDESTADDMDTLKSYNSMYAYVG